MEDFEKFLFDNVLAQAGCNSREEFSDFFENLINSIADIWKKDKISAYNKYNGVESPNEVFKRTINLINKLEEKFQNKKILLVSHGDVLQILQTGLLKKSLSKHRQIPHLKIAEIRELKLTNY